MAFELFNRVEAIWDGLKEGKAKHRAHFEIPQDHVIDGHQLMSPFKKDEHYLQVVINEMFVVNSRKWYMDYEPMAFAASSYIYDDQEKTFPSLVGPSLLQQFHQEAPPDFIYQDTEVTNTLSGIE